MMTVGGHGGGVDSQVCVQLTMAKVQKLLISQNKEQSCAIDEEGTEHLLGAAIWGL